MRDVGKRRGNSSPGVVVAVVLLVGTGGGYRHLQGRYADLADSIRVIPGSLSVIPMSFSDWDGIDVPLDPNVIQATDTDDLINREYARGRDMVSLYVAMGVRIRDLIPHRPEVCYIGAGWTLEGGRVRTVSLDDGTSFQCRLQEFSRGSMAKEHINVLHYYIVDGRYCADVSLLRKTAWRFDEGPHYSAQVHLVASGKMSGRNAEMLVGFASLAANPIRDGIMRVVEDSMDEATGDEATGDGASGDGVAGGSEGVLAR